MILVGVILAVAVIGFLLQGTGTVSADLTQPQAQGSTVRLSASQIAMYASNAGFSGDDLITAVAIALAESAGDPNAQGDNGTSYGLWQIHWTVHPEFDKGQLFDPGYNAQAAYTLYEKRGEDFSDWSTYTVEVNGVLPYTRFLDQAQGAVSA